MVYSGFLWLPWVVYACFVTNGVLSSCPSSDWLQWGSECYLFERTPLQFNDALTRCTMQDGQMVSINTQQELVFLREVLSAADNGNSSYPELFWIGFYRDDHMMQYWRDGTAFDSSALAGVQLMDPGNQGAAQCSTINNQGNQIGLPDCDSTLHRSICERQLNHSNNCNIADGWRDLDGACYKLYDITSSWNDARQECQSQNGDLYFPPLFSAAVLSRLITCHESMFRIWIGVTDAKTPGTVYTINNTLPNVNWEQSIDLIVEPGNSCGEVVVLVGGRFIFQTDVCQHEKRFVCQKSHGTCPAGWEEYNGKCYLIQSTPDSATTWFIAKEQCANLGAELLIINDFDEHGFISRKISEDHLLYIWLGFSDEVKADNLLWVDGNPANGTGVIGMWAQHFPGPIPNTTDCGIMQAGMYNQSWSHGYCYNTRAYICELPKGQAITSTPSVWSNYTCPPGASIYRDQCYYFLNQRDTWDNSASACGNLSGHLAIIKDPYVESFLRMNLPDTSLAWIGLTMDINNNKYYWVDNTEVNFTNYVPGEPNGKDQGFYCIEMITTGSLNYPGGWIDNNCSLVQDYICQLPATQNFIPSQPPTYAWTSRCDMGWRLNSQDGVCYLVVTGARKSWLEAGYDCKRRGGDLISISSPTEQLQIESLLRTVYPQFTNLWIGATDSTLEGGWEWSDRSPFRYLHWHPGEPNDQQTEEDCVNLVARWNYEWNDRSCDHILDYICKKPAKPPVTTAPPSVPTLLPPNQCVQGPVMSGMYSVQSLFAFSSSSSLDDNHTAADSRLLDNNYKSWRPSQDRTGEYLQVTFYQTYSLGGLSIAGERRTFNYVTRFKIQYQYSLYSPWYWIENATSQRMVFEGGEDDTSPATVIFPRTILAQSVRLYPDSWSGRIAVRWELNGCLAEPCAMDYAVSGPLVVMDGGLFASSISDANHTPANSRLHPIFPNTPPSCWRPADPVDLGSPPWIEVNFGTIKLLRGITVMGNPDADEYVTLFQVQYRLNDGSNIFTAYQEPYGIPLNFTGNVDHNSSVTYVLKSAIAMQHLRVVVLGYHGHPALRFDVLVCSLATCKDIPLLSGVHNVSNFAFSASSSRDPQHGPYRARMGPQYTGAWVAEFFDNHQYLQVDLGENIRIWAVSIQGSAELNMRVLSYTLAFSQDGQSFNSYAGDGTHLTVFDGNFDATTVVKHYLMNGVITRYVQLWATDFVGGIAVRWEIYGCPGPDSGQYLGCFLDNRFDRDLPYEPLIDPLANVGPISCSHHCFDRGYAYAGLQSGLQCYCGNSFGKYDFSLTACTSNCQPPYEREKCGGRLANSIYTTGLTAAQKMCDIGWVGQGNSCYMLTTDQRTWFDAQMLCRQQGGDLASVKDVSENNYVFGFIANMATQGLYGSAWIGLNDIHDEYFYQWSDGMEVTFTNWDLHMPTSHPTQEQHCVAINNQTGGWKTVFCDKTMLYLCKAPKKPSGVPHLTPVEQGCEKIGWKAFLYSCYSLVPEMKTWADARQMCQAQGGHLVQINDRYEQAFVSSLLGSMSGVFWSDVTDLSSPSTYRFSDNTFVTFTNWGSRQPSSPRTCVALNTGPAVGLWSSFDCTTLQRSICENPRTGFTPLPTPPLVPPGARCPQDWYESKYSCFQVNAKPQSQQLNWDEAREDCQTQGADLASFHSHDDLNAVWRNSMVGNDANFFIGLHFSDQEMMLKWSDGSAVNFVQWADGQSDALLGLMNCVEIYADSGYMAHQKCAVRRNWVCSIPRGVVPTVRTTVTAPTAGPAGSCGPLTDAWKEYQGACYFVQEGSGDNAMTWREARSLCQGMQTELLSITSRQEQLFVQSLISNASSVALWTGLNKLNFGHGFQWSDGSPITYENWDVGEPNNMGYLEYCVDILSRNGRWTDEACTQKRGFICKQGSYFTPPPVTSTTPSTGYCPSSYSAIGNKCLRVFGSGLGEQLKSWQFAWDACSKFGPGYNLASISSVEENLFIVTQLGHSQLSIWIGLTVLSGGGFAWTDSSEITYTNWDDGEPSGGMDGCVYLRGTSSGAGLWSDAPCGIQASYVCQTTRSPRITTPEAIPNPCDAKQGFQPFKSGCYKYMALVANWTAASQSCNTLGANLATITDAFVQAFLQLFVASSVGGHIGSDNVPIPSVWIGLNDLKNAGAYVWTLGWPMTYSNWGLDEPSRQEGEGCVRAGSDGLWVDDDCSQSLPYVCAIINENYTNFTPQPPLGQCIRANWVSQGDYCYLFRGLDRQTFYEAELKCQDQQAHLTSIHDNATAEFLKFMMVSITSNSVWIGFYGSQTSGFAWLDHTPADYTNWAAGEPSGQDVVHISEHCVAFNPNTKAWRDLDCAIRLGYICRKAQEVDNSVQTRPPVSYPYNSPPTVIQVPQRTPVTIVRSSTSTPAPTARATSKPTSSATTFTHNMASRTVPQGPWPTQTAASVSLSPAPDTGVPYNRGRAITAGVVVGVVAVCVFGLAILLFIRQRQGVLEPLRPQDRSFANILYRLNLKLQSQKDNRQTAAQQDVKLKEMTQEPGVSQENVVNAGDAADAHVVSEVAAESSQGGVTVTMVETSGAAMEFVNRIVPYTDKDAVKIEKEEVAGNTSDSGLVNKLWAIDDNETTDA